MRLEWLAIAVGVALRIALTATFPIEWSYDFHAHLKASMWIAEHGTLPALDLSRASYHPPLYYGIAALALVAGLASAKLGVISLLFGITRLFVIWYGVRRILPGDDRRWARVLTLWGAAVLPTSVHLDAMATNEALSCLLATVALVLLFRLIESQRWDFAVATGVVIGLALLTKLSNLIFVPVVLTTLVLDAWWHRVDGARLRRSVRSAALLVVSIAATAGWYYAHNRSTYGKWIVSGYDGPDRFKAIEAEKTPYLERRRPMFYVGWSSEIYERPYWPSATADGGRLWPIVIASTFVDYYNYSYARLPKSDEPSVRIGQKLVYPGVLRASRASVIGGTLLALAAAGGCALLSWVALRRRRASLLALALVPAFAILGQIHFATAYPLDQEGVVKGLYLQFAAAPLYGVVGWLFDEARRRRWWAWVAATVGAWALVASYSIYCRVI